MMKKIRIWAMMTAAIMLLTFGGMAMAAERLDVSIDGTMLKVRWETNSDDCVLTVYQNSWPFVVCNVKGVDGGKDIPLNNLSGKYSVRLKTDSGCLTADIVAVDATRKPTIVPTATKEPEITFKPVYTAKPTAVSTPAATRKPSAGTNQTSLAAGVVEQVNIERAKLGLSTLRVDPELTRAACIRAREIVEKFSHTRPDGSSWSSISASAYGENIAKGQKTVDRVMASWMSSDGHRKNILKASFGSIGVCAYVHNGITYWVQLFGK